MEPSCGSGSFFSALVRGLPDDHKLTQSIGVELDPRFAAAAQELWSGTGLDVVEGDFTTFAQSTNERFDLLIANPPYVRHHHLAGDQKKALGVAVGQQLGIKVSGLAGLYVYFVLLSHRLLAPGAVSAWLIPTEFMDVNYGSALRDYLGSQVSLLRIHRFDPADVQFDDALVSSAIVIFENTPPPPNHEAVFSYGGSLEEPREQRSVPVGSLPPKAKWSSAHRTQSEASSGGPVLGDFFKVRRGIATGANGFFIMPRDEAQALGFQPSNIRPILPSPRYMDGLVIEAEADGWPVLDKQLALIDSALSLPELEAQDPALAAYLMTGEERGATGGYLVKKRSPWYRQEQRKPSPFLCTYMGRGIELDRPFRFIWNKSDAIATNMFLMMYPIGDLAEALSASPELAGEVHAALLDLAGSDLRDGGRVYGGGLHKIEPKELGTISAEIIAHLIPDEHKSPRQSQFLP